jgi:hypothetical protein
MNLQKSKPDKFKKLTLKQDQPKAPPRPPTLGEPTMTTDWDEHISSYHKIKHFAQIKTEKDGRKQAYVTIPDPGTYFTAGREDFCGYYYIWLLCIQEKTRRIKFRINTVELDFVLWDVPEKEEDPAVIVPNEK